MVQLMPLSAYHLCCSKIQNGLSFWYQLTQVVLEKRPLNDCGGVVCLQAWTAVQIFKGRYVCTACYQLPLIQGSPVDSDLMQMVTQPLQTWLTNSIQSGQVYMSCLMILYKLYKQDG